MDQVQWALKELAALREEHAQLGSRVQSLEALLRGLEREREGASTPAGALASPTETMRRVPEIPEIPENEPGEPPAPTGTPSAPASEPTNAPTSALTSALAIEEVCSNIYTSALRARVEIGLIGKATTSMRHHREEPCVVLRVAAGDNFWYIAKTFNQLKALDTALRTSQQALPPLPTKDQWQSSSPIKIDVRIDLLNSYLAHLQELMHSMPPPAHSVYLLFMSSSVVALETTVFSGFLVSKSRFSGWRPRFCVLNGQNLEILDKPGGTLNQTIHIPRALASAIPDNFSGSDDEYRNGITISEQKENSSKSICHYFSCESNAARERWLKQLQNPNLSSRPVFTSVFPFTAVREGTSFELDTNSTLESTTSSSSLRDRIPRRRESSLTIDSRAAAGAAGAASDRRDSRDARDARDSRDLRISSPQAAIAITQPSGGPTSAFATHRRVFSPPKYAGSPLSGPGPPTPRSSVFRVPLAEALGYSSVAVGDSLVPTLVGRCIDFLYTENAYLEEGLFRISGTQSQVDSLEVRFERDEVDIGDLGRKGYDVHAVSSVLKRYFRLLPEPLIPPQDEAFWGGIMALEPRGRVRALQELVHTLPQENYDVLDVMTQFLEDVRCNSDVNKMTPQNLGIVFSPTLGIPGPVIIALIEDQGEIFSP